MEALLSTGPTLLVSVPHRWQDFTDSSVVKKSAAADATIEEDVAVSDRFKWCLNIVVDIDDHRG